MITVAQRREWVVPGGRPPPISLPSALVPSIWASSLLKPARSWLGLSPPRDTPMCQRNRSNGRQQALNTKSAQRDVLVPSRH